MKQSVKQSILRKFYPVIKKLGSLGKNGSIVHNKSNTRPFFSIYDYKIQLNNGEELELSKFKGKKLLLVNTASNCGYTAQYEELQKLHEQNSENIQIIAFPANDFADQEQSNDDEIAEFCKLNYGVSFPIAIKGGVVVKNSSQQPVFKWLTDKNLNGWNTHEPDWNFSKYLLDENGVLLAYFGPSVSPLDQEILSRI
jgi:glutathione peroxidase